MMVYVNGQDIARLVVGLLDATGEWVVAPEEKAARPEAYLAVLDAFLLEHQVTRSEINAFALVKGPGSATSLRAAHACVNTLAFALGGEVVSFEKAADERDADMRSRISEHKGHTFALPTYAHTPNITQTNRDVLKRKIV
ncbi:MAG: TsaD protein [Patescibacteria group bacterium]|nr:TsaD protein [Patescibacteria group bacterium]